MSLVWFFGETEMMEKPEPKLTTKKVIDWAKTLPSNKQSELVEKLQKAIEALDEM